MPALSKELIQMRMGFIEEKFEEIKANADSDRFYLETFFVFAKLGLQQIAEQEGMLNKEQYSDPKAKETLLERIREFLSKYIK